MRYIKRIGLLLSIICQLLYGSEVYILKKRICFSFENQWILSQCAHAVIDIDQHWHNRDFHLMNKSLRQFLYFCLCDVYLESVKRVLNEPQHLEFEDTLQTLYVCLTTGLRLLHPLMPFVTEELYQRINAAFDVTCSSISIEAYPTPCEVSIPLVKEHP